MINRLKYATVLDIGVTDLIYYQKENEKELLYFCKINGITYLPSRDKVKIYKNEIEEFTEKALIEDLCLNPYDRIFDDKTFKKFEQIDHNEIRFIVENQKIKGVVHIVDYNNEFLQIELYRALYRFENNLRKLLILNGYANDDFINWVRDKTMKSTGTSNVKHWERRYEDLMPDDENKRNKVEQKRQDVNPFQTFYFMELLYFAADKKLIDKKYFKIEELNELRNSVAHSKDFTSFKQSDEGNLVYNYENLKKFIVRVKLLFDAYESLEDILSEKIELRNL